MVVLGFDRRLYVYGGWSRPPLQKSATAVERERERERVRVMEVGFLVKITMEFFKLSMGGNCLKSGSFLSFGFDQVTEVELHSW